MLFLCCVTPTICLSTETKEPMTLRIEPTFPTYDLIPGLGHPAYANVDVKAYFYNQSRESIALANPSICYPAEFVGKESLNYKDVTKGKLEMVVLITTPDGREIKLKDLDLFFPEGAFHLAIAPGESKEILLSKFSPYFNVASWMIYDDKAITEPLFGHPGTYQMTVAYKNIFPECLFNTENGSETIKVWTGEVVSNTIEIEIKPDSSSNSHR